MAKKYYAVLVGSVTGIFDNWDECKNSVDGFPGAKYKAFKTKKEAAAYINAGGEPLVVYESDESDIPLCPDGTAVAFVDGSYDSATKRYAFGCVIITPDQSQTELSGVGDKEGAVQSRNVAGELMGAMSATKWAYSHGFKNLVIYHDYEGIAKWFLHAWKAESYVATAYLEFMQPYRTKMNITFEKVAAHTGNTLNERVDTLAKAALGID